MKNIIKKSKIKINQYIRNIKGTIMVAFAVMAPVLLGASGFALDYSMAYLSEQRLASALDAAALAGASSSSDEAEIEQKIRDFFNLNYPPEEVGFTYDPVVTFAGDNVIVSGDAYYNTSFLRILGINEIEVAAETTVTRQMQAMEVVLVMDNTGSMSRHNNISVLREAAANFVNIIFNSSDDAEFIKIGLVPYSSSVNVGQYGLGKDHQGEYYDEPFMNNPFDLGFGTRSSQWQGCVLAHEYPDDTTDHMGPWDMYRYCRDIDTDEGICDLNRRGNPRRNSNHMCPDTELVPLTNDQDRLLESIASMRADGYTLGNFGMTWGYRVLSPDFPFQEGVSWANDDWRKVIIMMTDGVNSMHKRYTAYGPTADHDIGASDLNDRFLETCEELNDLGVSVYTITFTSGVNERTKDYYRGCATSLSQYYDAPTQDDLLTVFETIGRELSNLHISK